MSREIFESQTIIAKIDPRTGTIISSRSPTVHPEKSSDAPVVSESSGAEKNFPEKTVIVRNIKGNVAAAEAVFLPSRDPGAPADETAMWEEESVWAMPRRLVTRFVKSVKDVSRRRLLFVFLAAVSATVLVFAFEPSRSKVSFSALTQSAAAESISSSVETTAAVEIQGEKPLPSTDVEEKAESQGEDAAAQIEDKTKKAVRLKDAVDALTEGRLDDAVKNYQALLEKKPNDLSIKLVLRILQAG